MHCYLKQRKENGIWYIWEYDAKTGQCSKHSTGTRDREEADQALAQHVLSIPARQKFDDPTLVQVIVRYWQLYAKDIFGAGTVKLVMGRVAMMIPEMRVTAFTPIEQEKFVAGLCSATAKRYLGQIHAALNWAKQREEISAVPTKLKIQGVDRPGAKPLTIGELHAICNAAKSTRQRLFLAIAIATAQRPAHVLELTWDRVDFVTGVIDFQDPERKRTKKVRPTVPMCPVLQQFLIEHRSIGPVVSRHGKRLSGHRTMFRRLCRDAGVTGSAYGIRKAAATYLRRQGVPEMDLKGMLGHRLGGNTDRYAHLDPRFMEAAKAAAQSLIREVAPNWLAKFFPVESADQAKLLKTGAGNEARTRDLNLGKDGILQCFQSLKPANEDLR
jgi:integrase